MKKLLWYSVLLILFIGCKKESAIQVEENGLTVDINSLVPQSTIDRMEELGLPINTGATPPNLSGIFNGSPWVLVGTTITNDFAIGYQFSDFRVEFKDQDNKKLTIKINYVNGSTEGTGVGSYIVGSGNKFTIFAKLNLTSNGKTALSTRVISGTIESGKIKDMYGANFMIDNYGNTTEFMGNGEGRVSMDSDGSSEQVTSLKSGKIDYNSDDLGKK